MPSVVKNIKIEQGATFRMRLRLKDTAGGLINLTGVSARMMIRSRYESATALVSLTSEAGGGLTMGGSEGWIDIVIEAAVTTELDAPRSNVYDLEIEWPGGEVRRVIEGKAEVSPEVTR